MSFINIHRPTLAVDGGSEKAT